MSLTTREHKSWREMPELAPPTDHNWWLYKNKGDTELVCYDPDTNHSIHYKLPPFLIHIIEKKKREGADDKQMEIRKALGLT